MAEHDCEPRTTTGSSATHLVPRFPGLKIERQPLQKKPLRASCAPEEAGKLRAAVCMSLEHDLQRRCLEREIAAKMSRPLTVVFGPPCRPVERDMALHSTARDKQEAGQKKQSQDDFLSLRCSLVELVEDVAKVAVEKEVAESVTSWDAATGAALLKTRCETSGSCYAMFWERSTRGGKPVLTVADGYVTPARKASLVRMGMSDSYPDSCRDVVLDEAGDNMVAKALRSKEAICIDNVPSCPGFARRDKAARYGIQSITFLATAGGVMEYGTVHILNSTLHSDFT